MTRLIKPSEADEEARENHVPVIHNLEVSWWNWLAWRFFEKSVLPFSGGFMEQPSWIIDDMMAIEAEYQDVKEMIDGT